MELSKEKMLEIAERKEKCIKCEKQSCFNCDNFVCASKSWGEEISFFEKIRELMQADVEGRMVVLPSKLGDTVYEVQKIRERIQPYTVTKAHITHNGISYEWVLKDGVGVYSNVYGFSDYAIGDTVFLTREEAEAALEKIGGRLND